MVGLIKRAARWLFLTADEVSGRPIYTHGPFVRRILMAYLLTNIIVCGLAWWQWSDIHEQCRDGRTNREAIRASIIDGLPGYGARYDEEHERVVPFGVPTIEYYRIPSHNFERQRAIRSAIIQLERFPTIDC